MYYMPCIDSKQKLVLERVRLFAQIINALAANPSADTHTHTLTCILAHSVNTCVCLWAFPVLASNSSAIFITAKREKWKNPFT